MSDTPEPTSPTAVQGIARWWARQPAGLRRAAYSMGWMGLVNIVRMAAGLVVGVYVARHLGPASYGVIGYATGLMLIGSALSRMGLEDVVTRDLVRDPGDQERTLGSAFALRLCGGIAAMRNVLSSSTACFSGVRWW